MSNETIHIFSGKKNNSINTSLLNDKIIDERPKHFIQPRLKITNNNKLPISNVVMINSKNIY